MGKRDLMSVADLNVQEIRELFALARELKEKQKQNKPHQLLKDKTMALVFEKPSLRTRCAFEVGMYQLGGYSVYLAPADIELGQRESVADIARNLERWFDLIVVRTFAHSTVQELAAAACIPVINALSDFEHPCQALADFFTLLEHRGKLDGLNLTFIGDGNNICNSLILLSAIMGTAITVASPEGYEPLQQIVDKAQSIASDTGGRLLITNDPIAAVSEADAVYTDVWASMGQEEEMEKRRLAFLSFQVNAKLLSRAPADVLIMHDLPARKGEEITTEVFDSANSVIFDQAENRLHIQKAIMVWLWQQSKK